jgi:hypothetical protein
MQFVNKYIAPWALPNEAFPIHCVWTPEEAIEKIIINIPSEYALEDTLNFTEYEIDNLGKMTINLKDVKTNNYFGIALKYPFIIKDIEKRDDVDVTFLDKRGSMLGKTTFKTRIVRPKLELLNPPQEIIVTDNTNLKKLINLQIAYRGLAAAKLNTEVTHSGNSIGKIDSIYFEALKELYDKVLDLNAELVDPFTQFKVDEEVIKGIANNFFTLPNFEKFPLDKLPFKLDDAQWSFLKEILSDETKREAVFRVVYASLRSLLLSSLLYYGECNPEEGIKLLDGKIVVNLKNRIGEFLVVIKYSDSLNNVYEPLKAKLRVIDMRKTVKIDEFDAPINIVWKKHGEEEEIC